MTTGLGLVDRVHLVQRTGARPGDLVCITGTPGQAQAWLDGYKQFEKALFEPQPRVAEGQLLARGGVSAMMDDSDGIALSLYDLMSVNACGFSLDSDKLPLPAGIPGSPGAGTGTLRRRGLRVDLHPAPEQYPVAGVPCTVIGKAIPEKAVLVDGKPVEKRGYQHRWA